MYPGDSGQLSPVGRECFRKAVDQLKGTGQLFVLEKMLQNQFPGAFEAQRCIRNGRIRGSAPGIVDVNVTQSETKYGTISYQRKAQSSIHRLANVRPENQRPSNLRFITGKNVDRSGVTKSLPSARTRYYHYGYVRNRRPDRISRIAWSGRMAKNAPFRTICSWRMTVHKAQGSEFSDVCVVALNIPTICQRT
jgi:hypothetical protein